MTASPVDRRHFRRSGIAEHGIISARVRPGHYAAVVDVSAGGALVEIARRLLPGASVELQIETAHRRTALRGRVLRCAVTRLHPTAVAYRAAIAFDLQWPGFADTDWHEYLVPGSGGQPSPADRVSATPNAR